MAICFCFFLVFAYLSSEPDKSVNISSTPIPFNSLIQITETPILSSPTVSPPIPSQTITTESFGTVTKVVDGDTIDVNINGIIYRVRYIGMNTPETNEVCGNDATTANSALVANQSIRLMKDLSEVDRYGRLLGYVYVGDLFVNAELIKQGWAEAAAYPPDVTYASYFEELELQAASANLACYATGVFGNGSAVIAPPISDISVCSCSRNSYNCPNFSTHDQAQACFNYCKQTVGYDVHRLDRDNDGLACEKP